MGLFNKLFRSGDPLATIRQAVRQQRWADVRREGEGIDCRGLSAAAVAELISLMELAGNNLAEINLVEGEASLRADDVSRAIEHFQLAASHACDETLKERARNLLELNNSRPEVSAGPEPSASSCRAAGCMSRGQATNMEDSDGLDLETRLELVLSSYPEGWRERYLQADPDFKKALLLAHDGFENEALTAFDAIAQPNRNDLFFFERGALLLRMRDTGRGRHDLEAAVASNGRHVLALELLVQLDLAEQNTEEAERRLHSMLASGMSLAFCFSRLAMLSANRGDEPTALEYSEQALRGGSIDAESLLLLSSLFEKAGRLDEAEQLLASLSGVGCGGDARVFLAEFWLRHGRSLEKALESFKAAYRREPANLHWVIRIAHAYVLLGWHKEGREMIKKVLSTPDIDEILRREAEEILSFCGK